jgi:hypothetical protein
MGTEVRQGKDVDNDDQRKDNAQTVAFLLHGGDAFASNALSNYIDHGAVGARCGSELRRKRLRPWR